MRVNHTSCDIHPDMSSEIKDCFAEYSIDAASSAAFGPGANYGVNDSWPPNSQRRAWIFSSAADLASSSSDGGDAGFIQDLTSAKSKTEFILADLKANNWLDRATRFLFIDFTVYNANVNLFCQIRLRADFPPTGGVLTFSSFRTVDLIRLHATPLETFVITCQVMFCIFIIYYFLEEALQIRKVGFKAYFSRVSNYADVLVITLGVACIGIRIHLEVSLQESLRDLISRSFADRFVDFQASTYKRVAVS